MGRKVNNTQLTSRYVRTEVLHGFLQLTEDELYSEEYGLTAQQWQAVSLLVAGRRQVDVAQELGVTEETVSRWKTLPTFTAALNMGVRDAYEGTLGKVRTVAQDALDVLQDLLKSQDERVRLSAALSMLRLHVQLSVNVHALPVAPADIARRLLEDEKHARFAEDFL